MATLIERLNNICDADHDRGCEGRCYTCSCGFDQRTLDAARDASGQLAELLGVLKKARDCLYAAVKANVDIEGFDPAEHVAIKWADAAIAKAEA